MSKRESRSQIPKEDRKCEYCGSIFQPRRHWQRFCSKECRLDRWLKDNPLPSKTLSDLEKENEQLRKELANAQEQLRREAMPEL